MKRKLLSGPLVDTKYYHIVIMLPISSHRNLEEGKEGEMRKFTCSNLITPSM